MNIYLYLYASYEYRLLTRLIRPVYIGFMHETNNG